MHIRVWEALDSESQRTFVKWPSDALAHEKSSQMLTAADVIGFPPNFLKY